MGENDEKPDLSNVISIEHVKRKTTPEVLYRQPNQPWCMHQIRLDVSARLVTCGKCEELLDPFDALLHLTQNWKHYERNSKELAKALSEERAKLENLHREVRNLKAQKKRLTKP